MSPSMDSLAIVYSLAEGLSSLLLQAATLPKQLYCLTFWWWTPLVSTTPSLKDQPLMPFGQSLSYSILP